MSALLYLQQHGNLFEVRVTTTVPVNAWEGRLFLPADLRISGIFYGAGIGDVWQTPPAFSGAQEIGFAGGATAGFTGDGLLFRFTASAPVKPAQLIRFDAARTALYAADGQGTPVAASLRPLTVNASDLLAATSSAVADAGAVPEPFTIRLVSDPQVFGGKPAIVFATSDFDSGIDHYEVQERTYHGSIPWHRAESPYLVDPDTTGILVKAVDRDGNIRTESIQLRPAGLPPLGWAVLAGIALLGALIAVYFIHRWKKRR